MLIVLIDDMGFGMSCAFGGPIHMPTVDRLAGFENPLDVLRTQHVNLGVGWIMAQLSKVRSASGRGALFRCARVPPQ